MSEWLLKSYLIHPSPACVVFVILSKKEVAVSPNAWELGNGS